MSVAKEKKRGKVKSDAETESEKMSIEKEKKRGMVKTKERWSEKIGRDVSSERGREGR
jgi:hypothetical protein